MKRLTIVIALALASCADRPASTPPPEGVPASELCGEHATADSQAICGLFEGFDLALTAIDGLRESGVLVRGTPRALEVQAGIREVQRLLNEVSAIQLGIRNGNLEEAFTNTRAAIRRLKNALD